MAAWRRQHPLAPWWHNGRFEHPSSEAAALNAELFEAQAAIARARGLVGLPGEPLVEIPTDAEQMQALSDRGKIWTITDDLALIRRLRTQVRELFGALWEEDPVLRARVAPLASELAPHTDEDALTEPWSRVELRSAVSTYRAAVGIMLVAAGSVVCLLTGKWLAMANLLVLPGLIAVAVRHHRALRGRAPLD